SEIAKELHVGGGIAGQGVQAVRGDVFSGGNIMCPGLNVDGAIRVPAGTTVIGATAAKGIVNEPVSVPKPCDCKSPVVDIAAVVDLISKSNDDAASGISPAELGGFLGSKVIELPCGRY